MGGGSSKGKVADSGKRERRGKGVKSLDALEIQDQEQLEKEYEQLQQQKPQSGDIKSQMSLFIGNNQKIDESKKGNRRSLSIMKMEEQQPNQKNEKYKFEEQSTQKRNDRSRNQDSMQANPSPQKNQSQSNLDSFANKDIRMSMQMQKSQSQFKTPIKAQQLNKQADQQKSIKQFKKDEISFDLSREMQPFANDNKKNPNFSCDISAIYSDEEDETPQQQAQRILKKLKQVSEIQKMQNQNLNIKLFNWPSAGECKIMSVNFKIIYSHKDKDLKLIKSYDYHTASTLQWQKNQQYKTYDFILQDNAIFDAHNASTTHLQNNIISFLVGEKGEFICIKDEQTFVRNVRKNQSIMNSRLNITNNHEQTKTNSGQKRSRSRSNQKLDKSKVIIETENQMKQQNQIQQMCIVKLLFTQNRMWSKSITEFLDKSQQKKGNKESQNVSNRNDNNSTQNESQQEHKTQKQILNFSTVHNGFNCNVIQKIEIQPKEKIENYLKQNLVSNEKYYNFCFKNPKKTIRDKLKVWNIVDEQDEYELMPKKFRFPVLRKHEITTGIMEDKNSFMRPHTITTDNCKMIVIDHKRDLFVDVEQEIKLVVFLWPERGDNQNEIHFYEELSKFKDMCDEALKSMVLDLSRVRALPLSYKTKLKKKYFELY